MRKVTIFGRSRKLPLRVTALGSLFALWLSSGCARQPPERGFLSGVRMHVIMNYRASALTGKNYYFFLINIPQDQDTAESAPGPVPVIAPPLPGSFQHGNGFATGSGLNISGPNVGKNTGGFTDFVLYTTASTPLPPIQNGFALYHVPTNGDANDISQFQQNGVPVSTSFPQGSENDAGSQRIESEVDLAQFLRAAAGQPISDAMQAREAALKIRFVQVNIISTDAVPIDQNTFAGRHTDAFGDTRETVTNSSLNAQSFKIIQVANGGVVQDRYYRSDDGSGIPEPPDNDVYPDDGDPAVDLTSWNIHVFSAKQ